MKKKLQERVIVIMGVLFVVLLVIFVKSAISNISVATPQVFIDSPVANIVITNNIPYPGMAHAPVVDVEKTDEVKYRDELERNKQKEALAALFAINHVNWVVTKIKNYNDPAILEEEYKNICADSLNLNSIKDIEIIELICDIMDVVTEMRIEEKEREMLKEELDQGMSDAVYDAFTGISAGAGMSPVSMVFNVVSSATTAAMNYKRAKRRVMGAYKKQTWALDKNRMRYLNELNKSLLQKYWAIVQRYNLPDQYRVAEKDIAILIDHLKDDDPRRLHSFLIAMEEKYKGLQNYWYYRGLTAEQSGEREDAKKSLEAYRVAQREYGQILRIDGIAAKAAMLRIKLMIEDDEADSQKYQEYLEVIERNSTIDEWQSHYFCALVYADQLNDVASAERVLSPVITRLDFKRHNRLIEWQDLAQEKKDLCLTNAVDRMLPSGDALYECRTVLFRLSKHKLGENERRAKLSAICENAGASSREKLFCYCSMRYEDALKKIEPDIKNINLLLVKDEDDDLRLKISLPMSWEISCRGEQRLNLSKHSDFSSDINLRQFVTLIENGERSIEERYDGMNCVVVDFGRVKDIKTKTDGETAEVFETNEDIKKIVYTIRYDRGESSSLMVVLEFDDIREGCNKPVKAYFGPWHVGVGVRDRSRWCYKPGTNDPDFVTVDFPKE